MSSVSRIARAAKQPRGGYLPLSEFDADRYFDMREVSGEYNINPALVGLAVDYGTRLLLGYAPEKVFDVALKGASLVGKDDVAHELVNGLPLDDEGQVRLGHEAIVSICKLSGFDSAFRAGVDAYVDVDRINPDAQTLSDIANLVERTIEFFAENGPVIDSGFSFTGGYSSDVDAADADYLTADTLWDLKVRKTEPRKESTLQVLLYYLMAQRSGDDRFNNVTKIGIFNPYLQTAWTASVTNLNEKMLCAVEQEVLCYAHRHGGGALFKAA